MDSSKEKTEHVCKVVCRLVSYDAKIHGYVERNKIRKLRGVKTKELMLWPPVNEIYVDDPPTGKIRFKSLAVITRTFPVDALRGWRVTVFVEKENCHLSYNFRKV